MNFANELYWGAAADKNKRRIMSDLRRGRFCPAAYVVVLSENGSDLLEIIPSSLLCNELYKKTHDTTGLKVVGIGITKGEAEAVMRTIVEDVYVETGTVDIKQKFTFKF